MNLFRKSFPMTDEQVIRAALKTVTSYDGCHPGDTFNTTACIDQVMTSVKQIWREARFYAPHQPLKREDLEEINDIMTRIGPELRARAQAKITECLKKRRIRDIDMAASEALISAEMRKRGLKFFYNWQKLRVRVSLKLDEGRAFSFIVKYKEVREGKLDSIIESVMNVVESLRGSRDDITVWPTSAAWKRFATWQE